MVAIWGRQAGFIKSTAVYNGVIIIINIVPSRYHHFGIGLEYRERSTREDSGTGNILKLTRRSVVLLWHPVREILCVIYVRTGMTRRCIHIVLIFKFFHRHGIRIATIGIIDHHNTIRTVQFGAPLGVKVIFLGNPKTVNIAICGIGNDMTPFVHHICKVHGFVINGCYRLLIQHNSVFVESLRTRRILVPTHKFIVGASSRRGTYMSTVCDTEIHLLVG